MRYVARRGPRALRRCQPRPPSSPSASSTRRAACSSSSTPPSAPASTGLGAWRLRKCFCRAFDFELQAAASDDGILLSLGEQHSFPLVDIFDFVSPATAERVLTQAVLQAPMFGTRFRWAAGRALALLARQSERQAGASDPFSARGPRTSSPPSSPSRSAARTTTEARSSSCPTTRW